MEKLDDLTFNTMLNILQSGIWLLNDLETYLRPLNMSQARLSIMLTIQNSENGDINPNTIAKITGKSKAGITRTIIKLSEDGLISILPDNIDGRSKKLSLTAKGNEYLKKIIPEYNIRLIEMSSRFTNEDKKMLNILLSKINFLDNEKQLWNLS